MISIIIPCKDRENDLKQCISSIYVAKSVFCNLYDEEVEVIVANDHSKDDFNSKIFHFNSDINVYDVQGYGPGSARNEAFNIARGKYVFFTDSDCVVDKKWLINGYSAICDSEYIVQGNPTLYQKKNWLGEQEELLYRTMFSRYIVNFDDAQMTDSRNLILNKKISEKFGDKIFADTQDKATAESRVFAKRAMLHNFKIKYSEHVKIYHKDPKTLLEACRQKYRHGCGRILLWDKKQDFNFLENRYFTIPIENGIDCSYVFLTHACFLLGFFSSFKCTDYAYYNYFLDWIKAMRQKYAYNKVEEEELDRVFCVVLG